MFLLFKEYFTLWLKLCKLPNFSQTTRITWLTRIYNINITFPARVIVENIIPRNVIINRGTAEVDNHISRDDIFDYYPLRECNIYFIIPNRTLDPLLFSEVLLLLNIPIMVKGDPKENIEQPLICILE